jgi:hypothetical protein
MSVILQGPWEEPVLYNKTKLVEEEIWSTWQKLTGDSGIQHWEGATWHCVKFNLACLWCLHSWLLTTYYTPCQLSILLFLPSHFFLPQPSNINPRKEYSPFSFLLFLKIIYLFIYLYCPPNSFVSNSPTQGIFYNK